MKVTWLNDNATEAIVMRGIFNIQTARVSMGRVVREVPCSSLMCGCSRHETAWVYDVTGNPVDHNVIHALEAAVKHRARLNRMAQSTREWLPVEVETRGLPRAKVVKS